MYMKNVSVRGDDNRGMIIVFINSNGKEVIKTFKTEVEFNMFCNYLDGRIEKGTCGGYIATK